MKLRFEDEAEISLPCNLSGFIARHMEQPASRHSKPASVKILSRPSFSAWIFTCWEPGTTKALTLLETLRPFATLAASRKSEMRPLVQLPIKATLMGVPLMDWPGLSSICL